MPTSGGLTLKIRASISFIVEPVLTLFTRTSPLSTEPSQFMESGSLSSCTPFTTEVTPRADASAPMD
ncbi:MAG: hypothetical protein QM328_13210, partial [Acidobacteriota bacterium]|nr:hypothetical protein [Acidobacteriota bacterium]